jgi:hypothetical protein
MRIFVAKTNPSYQIGITLMNSYGLVISKMFNIDYGVSLDFKEGYNDLEIVIKRPNLLPGVYKLNFGLVYAFGIEVYDKVEDAISFDYEINDVLGTGIPLTSDRGIKWYNVSFRLAN